jgi:hypothetical protein
MSILQSNNYGNKNIGKALDAFFGNKKVGKSQKISNTGSTQKAKTSMLDQLQLSSQTKLKSIISEYKQSAASKLSISINVKADKPISDDSTKSKLSDKAEKMLRLISRNDEEYKQLKGSFDKMFEDVLGAFKDNPSMEEVQGMDIAQSASISIEETSGEITVQDGNSIKTVKYSSYKLTMNFTNVEAQEASENKSIASAFTNALADFFGYGSDKSVSDDRSSANASLKASSASFSYEAASLSYSESTSRAARASSNANVNTVNTASSSYMRLQELALQGCDPIVLDLGGEGIQLTEAGKGANFDINADGIMDKTAWVKGNTAMLVYDKNGNNAIDNGSELFGDQNGAKDGFKELAKYDSNNDGKIDSKDTIYKNLKLYRDLNGDGKMQANEFNTLQEMGIKALNLECRDCDDDVNGNSIVLRGSFEREDGTKGEMADAIFGYSEL